MNFNLLANSTQGTTTQSIGMLIFYIVVIGAAMYFFMIRPNKKKQKKEEEMRNSAQVGDEILTIGGYYGKIVAIKEDSFIIECGPDRAKLRIAKWAIQQNFAVREPEPKEVIKSQKKTKEEKKAEKEEAKKIAEAKSDIENK